ncbi:MAG: PorV/PorQ family protein [Flavobacteriales bacterium]
MRASLSVLLLMSAVFLAPLTAYGQATTPKYSNDFLAIGVGARSLAMSNSNLVSTNDVTSTYWNPVGLLDVESDLQLGAMHAEYFAGIAKYDFGGVAKPLGDSSALGVSLIRFGVDDIPNTINLVGPNGNIDYDRISSFSAVDYAALISYSKKMPVKGLELGGTAKIIHRKVGDMAKAWGFGLDAGMRYHKEKWHFAALARDVTTTFNAWSFNLTERTKEVFKTTGNEIPQQSLELTMPRIHLGVSRDIRISEKFELLTELDVDVTTDGKRNVLLVGDPFSAAPHFGFELGYDSFIFLRGGIGGFQRVKGADDTRETLFKPTLGVGLDIKDRLIIDYALTDVGDQTVAPYSNIFSLKYNIFKLKGDR